MRTDSPVDSLKLAAISLTSTADREANIAQAMAAVDDAAARGADWVQLPEMFPYIGPYNDSWAAAATENDALFLSLAEKARRHRIVLIAGSVGERPPRDDAGVRTGEPAGKRLFNTCWVFGRDGSLLARYRKVHLFSLRDEFGQYLNRESEGFLAGDEARALTIDGWRVGLSICYDLRFPEFYAKMAQKQPLDLILVPSAFTKTTGQAHWHTLLQARAIEWLAYVFAANQVGKHGPGKESYGHSLIVDPWGQILADSGDGPGIAIAQISRSGITAARKRLQSYVDRRPDVYS